MPLVRIDLFPGRTAEMKAELARRVCEAFADVCGTRPADMTVIYSETAPEDWFVASESYASKMKRATND